jgi:protein-S-isoprenylcysteine O-methyltransferase Ste14
MDANTYGEKRNKIAAVLIPNLLICTSCFIVLLNSIDKGPTWRIILAAVGFAGMLFLTIAILLRLIKLQKEAKGKLLNS